MHVQVMYMHLLVSFSSYLLYDKQLIWYNKGRMTLPLIWDCNAWALRLVLLLKLKPQTLLP